MSANLSKTKGKASMMYFGEKPWHGLGTELQNPATSEEAMTSAGLDWKVEETDVRVKTVEGGERVVNSHKALYRSDTESVLSIVGKGYRPIQQSDAFSFMDSLVGAKEAMYHTAGALGKGERVWMMAKLPGTVTVKGVKGDEVEKFLLLVNSHDGTSALRCFFTPVRVVCQNTLNAALADAKDGVSIRHTKNAMKRIDEAKRILGIATRFYDDFQSVVDKLVSFKVSQQFKESYLKLLCPTTDGENDTRMLNIRGEISRLSVEGKGNDLPGVGGSMWALYNGVTEYVDHVRGTRGTDPASRASNRLNSVWFGTGSRLKQSALNLAVQLTN